jgi:ubiquinone/menaquinone biosynthesis C-methylase UbiE
MFSDPIKNLKAFGLREDNIVADLGAGTGFYSVGAGHIVTKGKVYAVEINKDYLHTIKNKVKDAHLNNVEIVWGNIEKLGGTKLKDGIVDAVIVSNVFSLVPDKDKLIEEIRRILKPKGRVLFIDWSPESGALNLKGAIPKSKALEIFEKQGFTLERAIDAGAHHYGIILVKN